MWLWVWLWLVAEDEVMVEDEIVVVLYGCDMIPTGPVRGPYVALV